MHSALTVLHHNALHAVYVVECLLRTNRLCTPCNTFPYCCSLQEAASRVSALCDGEAGGITFALLLALLLFVAGRGAPALLTSPLGAAGFGALRLYSMLIQRVSLSALFAARRAAHHVGSGRPRVSTV
jgi:hypothetical protein